jgi:hypothetical protein
MSKKSKDDQVVCCAIDFHPAGKGKVARITKSWQYHNCSLYLVTGSGLVASYLASKFRIAPFHSLGHPLGRQNGRLQ